MSSKDKAYLLFIKNLNSDPQIYICETYIGLFINNPDPVEVKLYTDLLQKSIDSADQLNYINLKRNIKDNMELIKENFFLNTFNGQQNKNPYAFDEDNIKIFMTPERYNYFISKNNPQNKLSLPGGSRECVDVNLIDCALREFREEFQMVSDKNNNRFLELLRGHLLSINVITKGFINIYPIIIENLHPELKSLTKTIIVDKILPDNYKNVYEILNRPIIPDSIKLDDSDKYFTNNEQIRFFWCNKDELFANYNKKNDIRFYKNKKFKETFFSTFENLKQEIERVITKPQEKLDLSKITPVSSEIRFSSMAATPAVSTDQRQSWRNRSATPAASAAASFDQGQSRWSRPVASAASSSNQGQSWRNRSATPAASAAASFDQGQSWRNRSNAPNQGQSASTDNADDGWTAVKGGDELYYQKYLKYKAKYLKLKSKIN